MVSVEGTRITYNNTFFENPEKNVDRQVLPVNIQILNVDRQVLPVNILSLIHI